MRGLFWVLAIAALAVGVAVLGRVEEGTVLVVYPPWRIEMSVLLFLLLLLGSFATVHLALRAVAALAAMPATVREFRSRRAREQSQAALAASLHAYFEGRYSRALKEAARAHESGPTPGLAALVAARAAHRMRNFEDRERWLERAESAADSPREARLVTKAAFLLEERDFEGAGRILRDLHASGPRHIATLRMLLDAERGAGRWEEVLRLANQLDKRDAIAPARATQYRIEATIELLRRSADDRGAFERRWRSIPASDQAQPRVAAVAAKLASALGAHVLAREAIERSLALDWTDTLVAQYGDLGEVGDSETMGEARRRLERGERWLLERPKDSALLSALGRLCEFSGLWGKAQSYYEASLAFEPSREALHALARLADRAGRGPEAERHLRRAAELSR